MTKRAPIVCASLLVAVGLAGADVASAEVIQKDGVRVLVTGEISPTELPRSGRAPVVASVAGRFAATKDGFLPKLERIVIALNSHGHLQRRGIPVCRLGRIDPSTTTEAFAACRSSLVGRGRFSANVRIPDQSPFPSRGKVLVFNGKLKGHPALFAHVYGTEPVPTSYVLPFLIRRGRGPFGTVLEASLPRVTGQWGYVTGVSLNLNRGYLTAGCPAPSGFPGVVFPLMRTSFTFADGIDVSSTLDRSCRVRR